jgi:NADH-quinone oxidoreductase subunit J
MLHQLDALLAPLYFWLFAGMALLCACGLLISRHPINGAVNLIGAMVALSGIYALLDSPFIAVLQVLVYAGAIMMLVVFVIMVLNQARDHAVPYPGLGALPALIIPVALGGVLVWNAQAHAPATDAQAVRGSVDALSATLFAVADNGYWLLFELTGVLLLIAAVAAVLLSKRSLDAPPESADEAGDGNGKTGGH